MNTDNANTFVISFTVSGTLLFFAILIYVIFGQVAEFNYQEAREHCTIYYEASDNAKALDRCKDDAQSIRQITNRIGAGVAIIFGLGALGSVCWVMIPIATEGIRALKRYMNEPQ